MGDTHFQGTHKAEEKDDIVQLENNSAFIGNNGKPHIIRWFRSSRVSLSCSSLGIFNKAVF